MVSRTPLPASIGRFRVESLLGVGGMGEVYQAVDPTLHRKVAIKTVRPDVAQPEYLARLYREAQACARLRHTNVVTVHEAGEIDGVVYIVMEYLEGGDLRAAMRDGALTTLEKIDILAQVLAGLQHTHAESVIHRDIKPSNVHRAPDGSVKLVDFGLAQVVMASPLTQPGAVMCTPDYASPEQLRDEPLDGRTDLYSTGALAYEMFTGRRPFHSDSGSVGAMILKAVSQPPPPMDVAWSRRFPELEQIVTRAMAKDPAARYQTAAEMRQALLDLRDRLRPEIEAFEQELAVASRHAAHEARTLVLSGQPAAAQALLQETLKLNPAAGEAKTLLHDLQRPPAAAAPAPITAPATAPNRAATVATAPTIVPPAAAPPQPLPSRVDPTAPPPRAAEAPQAPPQSDAPASSPVRWPLVAAAAALVLAVGGYAAVSRQTPTHRAAAGVVPASTPVPTSTPASEPAPPAAAATLPVAATAADVRPAPSRAAATGTASVRSDADTGAAPSTAAPPASSSRTPAPPEAGAKRLFSAPPAASAGGGAGLRFRITRRTPDGVESDVDPAATTFHSGDRVRFTFESNIDGYLYVVQQGSSGRWTVLFPNPQINRGRHAVAKLADYQVPDDDWFQFDDTPGREQVFMFLSREPVQQLPGFDRPVTRTETVVASVVDDLKQRVQSRDLVFEKDRPASGAGVQATYVVNRSELAQAVAASITLVHER